MDHHPTDTAPHTLGQIIDDRLGSGASVTLAPDLSAAILAGTHEISLDPAQLDDPLGSDRSDDWQDGKAFAALKNSIARDGQDMPIRVWPADPAWRPNPAAPLDTGPARFQIVAGRRRTAACALLGIKIRVVIAPRKTDASDEEATFDMLCQRFRENDARENLSPFERLTSVAELFEARSAIEGDALNGLKFAKSIGIAPSTLSRARALARHRTAITATCDAPTALSYRGIETIIAKIEGRTKQRKSKSLESTRGANGRNVTATLTDRKLTIAAHGVAVDHATLHRITERIAQIIPASRP